MNEEGKPSLQLRQQQQLVLTPALRQALQILAMPALELAAYIQAQALENPALELAEYVDDDEPRPLAERELPYDESAYEESWLRFIADTRYEPHLYAAAREAAPEWCAALPAREEHDLYSQLRLQLATSQAPPLLKGAAECIIKHLDEDGYLSMPLPQLAALCGGSEALLQEALALVQSLEPPGVAARDLRECLSLQIGAAEPERELLLAVIADHLEDVAANRWREAARALRISTAQAERAFARVRALSPRPAAELCGGGAPLHYIVPDVFIRKIDGAYQVFLNDSLTPLLHINPYYRRLDPLLAEDEQARGYMRQKLSDAESLLKNIEKRRQTVYRLAGLLVERQRDFLEEGISGLAPLTMREAAEAAGIHESTVSRAIAGKYVQTPRGVYEWKFFFPRAFDTQAGSLTPAWVKTQLKELIAAEDKLHPYSDQQLAELLSARGATVARRTVAKYREDMGIAARLRRKHILQE